VVASILMPAVVRSFLRDFDSSRHHGPFIFFWHLPIIYCCYDVVDGEAASRLFTAVVGWQAGRRA